MVLSLAPNWFCQVLPLQGHKDAQNLCRQSHFQKLLQKSKAKAKLQVEIKLHRDLNHRRIVKMKCWFEDVNNAYIVLELCPNLCMSQLVKRRKMLTNTSALLHATAH